MVEKLNTYVIYYGILTLDNGKLPWYFYNIAPGANFKKQFHGKLLW
jgi:hypothetical protein